MTLHRRALMQQLHDLRAELDQALQRAAAAEQELRDLRAAIPTVFVVPKGTDLREMPPGRITYLEEPCERAPCEAAPLPPEIPATPVAELQHPDVLFLSDGRTV